MLYTPFYCTWGFPAIGLLPVIIQFKAIFHEINHPAMGSQNWWKPADNDSKSESRAWRVPLYISVYCISISHYIAMFPKRIILNHPAMGSHKYHKFMESCPQVPIVTPSAFSWTASAWDDRSSFRRHWEKGLCLSTPAAGTSGNHDGHQVNWC